VTLDDAGPRAAANADPTGFVEALELPAVIDEFQKAPDLLPAIKSRVDRARSGGRRAAGMFLLTGSANVWATLRVSELLSRPDPRRRGRWLEKYTQMILERDVRELAAKAHQVDELPRLLAAVGARVTGC
jgi:hypothetical protein